MNILAIAPHGIYREISRSFVHNQLREFVRLGHRVRVIIPYAIGKKMNEKRVFPLAPIRVADGVEICYMRCLSFGNFGERNLVNAFTVKSAFLALEKTILKDFIPDVVHAHTLGTVSETGALIKRRYGCPLLVTTHGSDTTVPMNQHRYAQMRRLCDKADMIVAVSGVLRGRLLPCETKTPVVAVHNGFPLDHLAAPVQKRSLSFQQTSNLIELKKVDVTIRAFAQIAEAYPEAVLTVVGEGPLLAELKSLCDQLGVSDRVVFTGPLSNGEVFSRLSQTEFYVMPSVREGFPISYLEAMASRCVVIGTSGEGISEIVTDGENGFLVPPDEPRAIAAVVDRCMKNRAMMSRVAEAGYATAMNMTWRHNAEQYVQLFQSLIRQGS